MIQLFITFRTLLVFVLYNLIKKRDILTPGKIFFIDIICTYLLYCTKLSGIQGNYSIIFTIFILSLVLVFNIGTIISLKSKKNKVFEYDVNKSRFRFVTYLLFVLIVISFVAMWKILGPPPIISKADRASYFVSGFGTIFLLTDVFSFLIFYDSFTNKYIGKVGYIMLFIDALMIIAVTNKTQLFFLMCQYIILYNALKKKINIRKFAYVPFIVIIIFYVYYNYIYKGMYISTDYIYVISKMKFSKSFAFLTEPYLYVTYNYENLFNYISNSSWVTFGHGYYMLKDILELLKLNGNNIILNSQWVSLLKHGWLTTGTIFKPFYMDFGLVGTYIMTFILGLICGSSYRKYKVDKKNIFNLYFYSINMVSLFFAFFTNNFITINYLFNIFIVYIIYRFCYKKKVILNE